MVRPRHRASDGRGASAHLERRGRCAVDDLREQFKRDNLPIDDDLLDAEVNFLDYQDRMFVHQLGLIDVLGRGVLFAIKDYYRATSSGPDGFVRTCCS